MLQKVEKVKMPNFLQDGSILMWLDQKAMSLRSSKNLKNTYLRNGKKE